jgi:hypothetical protein
MCHPATTRIRASSHTVNGRFETKPSLYHYRNWYYDPHLGAFLSRDPIGYAARNTFDEDLAEQPFVRIAWEDHKSLPVRESFLAEHAPLSQYLSAERKLQDHLARAFAFAAGFSHGGNIKYVQWDNPYVYVRNNPPNATDPFGLWELRCRDLILGQKHCWVYCDGTSYSLMAQVNGRDATWAEIIAGKAVATKLENHPRDYQNRIRVAQGNDCCECIREKFEDNLRTYQYTFNDCNSNYFAGALLRCCGLRPARPNGAFGWGMCSRPRDRFVCSHHGEN